MANVFIEESTMTAIGDAIRAKTGGSNGILPANMPDEIASITTGGGGGSGSFDGVGDGSIATGNVVDNTSSIIKDYAFQNNTTMTAANFPKVTEVKAYAFDNCTAVKSAKFPLLTKISGAYSFQQTFAMETFEAPNLETLGGTGSFYRSGIVTLYLPKLKSSTGLMMFQESESLETVNLPEITTINSNQMFHKCPLLKNVYVPKLTTLTTLVFSSCTSLEVIDLPCVTKIGGKCFVGTTNLKAVILRSSTLATAGETIFKNSKIMEGTGFVYVPSALVDDYKTATNWTEYANQIRALEDYTVDGTTTGELDESKI